MRKLVSVVLCVLLIAGALPLASAQGLKERDQQLKENYKKAQENYKNALENYRKAKDVYRDAKEKFGKANKSENRELVFQKARDMLLRSVEVMERYIDHLQRKIESSPMSEGDKSAAVAELEAHRAWLAGKKAEIEAATTDAQLREIQKQLRERWDLINADGQRNAGRVIVFHLLSIIGKGEAAIGSITAKIDEVEKKGGDVKELEKLLNEYQQNLKHARDQTELAQKKFESIAPGDKNAGKTFREGMEHVRKAMDYLKQARKNLIDIAKELREARASLEPRNATQEGGQ